MNRKERRSRQTMNFDLIFDFPKSYAPRMWMAGKLIRAAELLAKQKIPFRLKQEETKGGKR